MPEYLSKEEVRQWRSSLEKITLEEFAKRLGKVINEEKSTNDIVDHVMQKVDLSTMPKEEYQTRAEKIYFVAQQAVDKERELMNVVKKNNTNNNEMTKLNQNFISKDNSLKSDLDEVIKKVEKTRKTRLLQTSENKLDEKIEKKETKNKEKINIKQNDKDELISVLKGKENKTKKSEVKKIAKKTAETKKTTSKKESKLKLQEETRIVLKKAFTAREQVIFDYLFNNKNSVVYAKDLATLLELPRDYIYKYIKGIRAKLETDILNNATKGGFILKI